jgi:hypothetical protein
VSGAELGDGVAEAMKRGDARAVADLLVAAPEKERRGIAGRVTSEWDRLGWRQSDERRHAAAVAFAGTTTARRLASDWWLLHRDASDELDAVVAGRGRAFMDVLAGNLLAGDGATAGWSMIRQAVRAGVIDRPPTDRYTVAMAAGITQGLDAWETADSIYRSLLGDPDLLADDVWRLFEVDCGAELANARVWTRDEGRPGLQPDRSAPNRWTYALTRLAAEGRLDRDRLLDASLDALLRDFRESSVGWYAQLHEALEPTAEERRARLDRYLALLASPSPAAMKEGLAGLKAVEDAVDPQQLAGAAATPLTQKQKNLAVETLRLLERAAGRKSEAAPELLAAAALALGHERPDVQERALALLERHAASTDVRAAVLGYADVVSPLLRDRLVALTGVAEPSPVAVAVAEAPPAESWPEPVRPRVTVELLRAYGTPLEPVSSTDELIELGASLVEGAGTGDDAERFLDGVSRLCDERPPELQRRAAGLVRRAEEQQAQIWGATAVALVATLVRAWIGRKRPPRDTLSHTVLAFLERRVVEVAERAARGRARPLLGFPTHAGGWIDPDVLAQREHGTGRFRNRPEHADRLQAHARAFPGASPPVFAPEVRVDSRFAEPQGWLAVRVERRASGLEPELAAAAEQPGTRPKPGDWWRGEPLWAGMDALSVSWCLTVLPTMPEIAYAAALDGIVERMEASAYYRSDVVLAYALDAHVPLEGLAWMAAGAGLLAKSPDLHRPTTDLLVQTIADGRFDPDALGSGIAWLVDNGFGTVSRLERPLRDAARVSPLHGAQVVRLVEALVARLTTAPRNLHVVLEVALEQATPLRTAVERADARAALGRIAESASRSSKLGRAARDLLALEPDPPALAALRGLGVQATTR